MSHIHVYDKSSEIDDMMYVQDEKETEGEKKESTVPEEKSDGTSPDLMSGMKLIQMLIQMVKMFKEGSLIAELLMCAIEQVASYMYKLHNVS